MRNSCNYLLRRTLLHLSGLLLIASITACTDDFAQLNTNENAPTTVQPSLLLRQVLYGFGDQMTYEGFVAGSLLSQHFAMTDFNLFDRHALASPQEGGNPWDILYVHLRDNETVLGVARDMPGLAVYEGPALVMKAFLAATLTDLFGDVPYFTAFSGRDGVVTPAYDAQEDIYLATGGILDNLRMAVDRMQEYAGSRPLEGDILFNGDLNRWIDLANSLRIKYLMRISGREDVATELSAIYREGRFITENDGNATFDFSNNLPNNSPISTVRVGIFNVFVMSTTSAAIYAALDDPRVATHFRPSGNGNDFRGLANGIDAGSTAITVDDFARPGRVFRENSGDLDYNYLTAWETHFFLAEAALRGWIDADPRELYERGVRQAFDYWLTTMPDDYLSTGPAAYDPDRALEQIITQKWIANVGNDYEAWTEQRRTGFPNLKPVSASLNGGVFPLRMPYPADEQALNVENYRAAAAATDGNSINVPVWWDIN